MMDFELKFQPKLVEPTEDGDYLLYNQCDGYHVVEAWIVDGEFCGFFFFADPKEVSKDFYEAWAKLPDTKNMYAAFARKDNKGA